MESPSPIAMPHRGGCRLSDKGDLAGIDSGPAQLINAKVPGFSN
jgi:hypothetical protein